MTGHILTFFLLLAGFAYGQFSADRVTIIRGAPCVAGELLVCFKTDSTVAPAHQNRFRQRMISQHQIRVIRHFRSGAEHWRIGQGDLDRILDSLNLHSDIKYAEPNFILTGDVIPDDPAFSQQWALLNSGQTGGTEDADIDADSAWDISTGSENILVGIIDSGIDETHPDLANVIWTNPGEIAGNGLDDDNNGYVDDVNGYDFLEQDNTPNDEHGHGTHVSGIIGAVSDNATGVAGVAWQVRLLPLKFLDDSNSGPTTAAITAIEYAVDMGVDLLNASWGSTFYSQALADAITEANNDEILFVASAGNSDSNNDLYPHYPSCYDLDNIISVASTDHKDLQSSFSNWGVNSVDLAAPGSVIYSTLPDSNYGTMNGTSMAAPFVTGTLVLARSVYPEMKAAELKAQLLSATELKDNLVGLMVSAGRLNAHRTIDEQRLPIMNALPSAIDFNLARVGEQTAGVTVVLENLSQDSMTIDSIVVHEGFLIARGGGWQKMLKAFFINAQSAESLIVCFAPQQMYDYRRLLEIYYHVGIQPQKMGFTQLSGRGVTGTIVQAGTVSGTWRKEDEPFYIMGDVVVGAGQYLQIEPDVNVQFEGHFRFTVENSGVLHAIGAENDSIRFYPYDERSGWNGLRIVGSGSDDTLRYCVLSHSHKSGDLIEDEDGGGVYISNSSPTITHTMIYHNSASGGGGLSCFDSHPYLAYLKILSNTSGRGGGGGMACYDSNPILQNVTIANNITMSWLLSSDNGGGLYCRRSSPRLINVTISGNWGEKGGGIYISQSPSAPTMVNSICWGNAPEEICFSSEPRSKSIAIAHSDIEGGLIDIRSGSASEVFWLDGNIDADPLFLDADATDFRLLPSSPCLDGGIQDTVITYNDGLTLPVPELSYLGDRPDMGAWESNGTSVYSHDLLAGWNLISWNIFTESIPPVERFSAILENLQVVLGFDGEGLTYDPAVPEIYNNLKYTDHRFGYWLKMIESDQLVLSGQPIAFPASVNLRQGWNLIGYLPVQADSVRRIFSNILSELILVESFDAGAMTFDPLLADTLNTLHLMLPGYGYWVKVASDVTLWYSDQSPIQGAGTSLAQANNLYHPQYIPTLTSSWMNIYAQSLRIDEEPVAVGTRLTVRDPDGVICGEMIIDTPGCLRLMPVYRDDPRTSSVDEGAEPGDTLCIFINQDQIPLKLVWKEPGQVENINDYITNIGSRKAEIRPTRFELSQNYPNPFNSQTIFPFQIPFAIQVRIDIYNILGQKMRELVNSNLKPDFYRAIWDGTNQSGASVASGIYFCRMEAGNYIRVVKIVLLN